MEELNLKESLELLKRYGIPVADTYFINSEEELSGLSEKLSFPLVVKPNTFEHKTEIGVFKNLKNLNEVKTAFRSINSEIAVQKMIDGYEIMLGAKNDVNFGHVIAMGSGGIFTELFEDVAFRIVPLTRSDFSEMMEETKLSRIAGGFRGFGFDENELYRIVKNFEKLVINENIIEGDINPLIANKKGIFAVDARFILG